MLAAVQLGQEWMALTDHSPRLTVANGLSRERLADQLQRVEAINASLGDAFTLLKGIEVDIHLDGTLDQDDDMLDQLDVVTASIHSKLRQPAFEMTPRMVAAVRNPRTNVLAHCTGPARHRQPREAPAVAVRRREGLPGLPRARRRRRDQLPSGALRPARRAHRAGPRPGLPLHHRLRRPRPGPARHEVARLRARRAPRHPGRAHRHDVARRGGPWHGRRADSRACCSDAPSRFGGCRKLPYSFDVPTDRSGRSPSSSGLGLRPFTAAARVRIPLGIRSTVRHAPPSKAP